MTIGLLIDVSGSRRDVLPNAEQKLAPPFFQTTLSAGDQASVMTIGATAQIAAQPTSDLAALQAGLDAVSAQQKWGPTALYDGIFQASETAISNAGRRVLVLVSDGDDNSSRQSLKEVGARLSQTQWVLEFVDLHRAKVKPGNRTFELRPGVYSAVLQNDTKGVGRLSETTGGMAYSVKNASEMASAFDSIAQIIRSQYALDFQPTVRSSSRPANVEIKCARRGVKLLAPRVY